MRRRIPLHVPLWLSLLAGCGAAENPPVVRGADSVAVEQELADRLAAYRDAIMSGNADAALSFWAPDARVFEPGMEMGAAELGEFVRGFFATGRVTALDVRPGELHVHGDAAYELGEYDETVEVSGGPPATYENYYFLRWRRQPDGTWLMHRFLAGPRNAPHAESASGAAR